MDESVATLRGALDALAAASTADADADRIDQIRLLEEIKSAAAAAQARVTADFVATQRAAQAAAGVPAERAGRGIAAQVGLARRCSPYQARRYVGWSMILTRELPATFALLAAGRITEWRAMLVARETAWLSREHRAQVDSELAPRLESLGDRRVEAAAKQLAYRLDPTGYVARTRAAAGDRRVTVRPAPDAMCRLTALLPVAQGVACYAALGRHADLLTGEGDGRSRGQVTADTLVERVTGQAAAGDVPVEVQVVMTDQALFATGPGADEPTLLTGYGPIPADIARDLIQGPAPAVPRWIRRLYTAPGQGRLTALESGRRLFTPGQRRFVALRDQTCRTPWCDAPIRHTDHVVSFERGGPTDVDNAQGLCAACNYAKEAPGWSARPADDGAVVTTTPTGHRYRSRAPDLPRAPDPTPRVIVRDRWGPAVEIVHWHRAA